jgi:starch phosphorylase
VQREFLNIKYLNKVRLAKYIKEHNHIDVDPHSIFDVQVKRLHEYKRQFMNILRVMYLYNLLKENPDMEFYPRTFIFGGKASAGYERAKEVINLINNVGEVINNDPDIKGRIKVVFIEDYRVSNAELIFAAADISEQISTASKEASGTGNMKFMINGAVTLGTMDGANVEIVEEAGRENVEIFGFLAQEIIDYEKNGGYNPLDYYNRDPELKKVLDQLINGEYSCGDKDRFRDIHDSLLVQRGQEPADMYFILGDFKSYITASQKMESRYRDRRKWAKTAIINIAKSGKFSSDRTIFQYVEEIWHLDKILL